LARECSENGLLNPELATGIVNVKGVARLRRRIGNWLIVAQTTERYIGCKQRLKEAVNDRFGIALSGPDG
jgi:hypothetical protein